MMSDIPHYERPEEEQDYYKSLVELLDHYEDGWDLMINAHKANDYDFPLPATKKHKNNPCCQTPLKRHIVLCGRL